MANTAQAKKRAKQNEVRRQRNMAHRSRMRTLIKRVRAFVLAQEKEKAQEAFLSAVPVIDGMVNKGIVHRNKAGRDKSRLSALIKKMA